jgi:TonB family protein
MRKELENIQIIEQYLRNELSSEDKIAFEENLKSDPNLQEEVEIQQKVMKGIERVGVKKSIQTASKKYHNRRRGFFLGLFIAAFASCVIGFIFLGDNPGPKEMFNAEVTERSVDNVDKKKKDNTPAVEVLVEQKPTAEVVSLPKKKYQYFNINASKDETITGAEGTKITFKANSFNVPENSVLKIRLKEYYKMSDIAFSNLTTETADGQLLETGGMLYIDALANNKKVDLKKDTFFDVKFPFDQKKNDMMLFDGKTKGKNIVWEESETKNTDVVVEALAEEWESEVFTIVEKMPEFKGGQKKMFEFLGKTIKYPAEAKGKNISGKVYVNFIIGTNGKIQNVKTLRGIHPSLNREAIRIIESMPNWIPGRNRGKAVNVSYNLPIEFKLDNNTVAFTSEQIQHFSDSLKETQENNIFNNDGMAVKKTSENERVAKSEINYYALSGLKLGWVNCDRYARMGSLNLAIKLENNNTNVKIIFHRFKSLISGNNKNLYSKFGKMPTGERVTVFAIKYVDKKPLVCLQEITTSKKEIVLEFEELTIERLKEITQKISEI